MLNIVVPMAGRGSRFATAGFKDPKPLIAVGGKPMIQWVIENVRPAQAHRFIFICLAEHLVAYPQVPATLRRLCPGCEIAKVDRVTEGAACTVLLARELIDNDHPLMIANSDQFVALRIDEYLAAMEQSRAEGLIMTFWSDHPKWSYCRMNGDGLVREVVEKQVVSNEATVGIYNFRRGRDFIRAADAMIARNLRVNNEFYVAPAYNQLIQEGARVVTCRTGREFDGMYGLGTPDDLAAFKTTSHYASGAIDETSAAAPMKVGVVGLGYVGLPLSLQFARNQCEVVGFDVDPQKVAMINRGESYIKHIDGRAIAAETGARRFHASADFSEIQRLDAVIICVPTPLNKYREPDISFILATGRSIAPGLRRGMLVVLESTTYPGTTDEDLRAVLEEGSGLKAGVDFHLAFSPEREDPGNPDSKVASIPKVVGGLTPRCLERATELYRRAIKTVVPVSSCRVAEATKLLENIFRSVNIALVNELKVVYSAMGIDIWQVIAAAKTKPFGFMPFYPGPGLGGHCIPIDPFYLTWKAREYGQHTRFIELAGEINTAMPDYVVGRVAEALNEQGKPLKGSRILILGLAYKANVDDDRESPSYVLINKLEARGAVVDYNDPHVPVIRPTREHPQYAGRRSEPISGDYDAVLLATAHDEYRDFDFSGFRIPVIDTRNAVQKRPALYYQA